MNPIDRLAARLVRARLAGIREGRLGLRDGCSPDAPVHWFGDAGSPAALLTVADPRFYRALIVGGHIGAVEAYAKGWWETDDLPGLVRIILRNREVLDGLETGWARLAKPARWLAHLLRRNTRDGSRRNIADHYDLGNDFFRLFLDETLTYSAAYFERPDVSLADAQRAKYDRLCAQLGLTSRHHLLEIGTGWGGFAIHAATRYGCRVTTATISRAQHRLATERIAAAGLADRVEVLLADYRDLTGEYDRLASIEMIEAVGHDFYGAFFETCGKLLRPDGLAGVQAITIQDRYYDRARRSVDFIKRHIFPGSCIPSLSALLGAAATTDLRLVRAEDFGPHYARTLREWRRRFDASAAAIGALGYDEWFRRLWRFYFIYCEVGFTEGALGVSQLVFAKPEAALQLPAGPAAIAVAA